MKASDIRGAITEVSKHWATQRKREERGKTARRYRHQRIYNTRKTPLTEAAAAAIPAAYEKVSDGGKLPANARQIFYAARKAIQEAADRPLDSKYFTKTLLPKFINDNPNLTADWWVVYDARGALIEPHTEKRVPVGTLEIDRYLRDVRDHKVGDLEAHSLYNVQYPTCGPHNRYQAVLFIEKEGFHPLFERVRLADRFDVAILSTKGQSVVAARRAVDELCSGGVPLLVLHDFDKHGLEIANCLTSVSEAARKSNRVRYQFRNEINWVDLGLRLDDVKKWGLEPEWVQFTGDFGSDSIATPEEQDYLRGDQRVELNEFASDDFIAWIEGKLEENGIKKLVPDDATLEHAYRRAFQVAFTNARLAKVNAEGAKKAKSARVPARLANQIKAALAKDRTLPWDEALASIVRKQTGGFGKKPRSRRKK